MNKAGKNARRIWVYGFLEIFNNAVEHSNGRKIHVVIDINKISAAVSISDDGIGIFKNIKTKFRLADEIDALLELAKGYEDIVALQERGINDPEHGMAFLREIMKIAEEIEGKGGRSGKVEILRDIFGFDYNEAIKFHDSYNPDLNDIRLNQSFNEVREMPDPGSKELTSAIDTMEVQNLIITGGMEKFWETFKEEALKFARQEYQKVTGELVAGAGNTDTPIPLSEVPYNIREEIAQMKSGSTAFISKGGGYFGNSGNRGSDTAAQNKLGMMFDTLGGHNSDDELFAAFKTYNILNDKPPAVRERWDSEDALNPLIAISSSFVELLANIKSLIAIEEESRDATKDLADMNIILP